MCLVSFLPINDGFILSSNRDESPDRITDGLVEMKIGTEQVIFPRDRSGGSWIMVSDHLRAICLLNGAFENHKRKLPYRHSRGVVMKSFFEYEDAVAFFHQYDLWNIEPFTMVIAEHHKLFELRWDGHKKYISDLDPAQCHIWSSATLYDMEAQEYRSRLLQSRLDDCENEDYKAIMEAHLHHNESDLWNGLVMNRVNIVKTISHTQVIKANESIEISYTNLIQNTTERKAIFNNILL